MTTIAANKGQMSGDGFETEDELIAARSIVKVHRLADGRIVGTAGRASEVPKFMEWLEKGGKPPSLKDFTALVMSGDGSVDWYDDRLSPIPAELPAAIGSGKPFALTAMDLGFSTEEAVKAASKRDVYTGGKITTLKVGG